MVKKKHSDARHWVYAYVLRENSTARFTDDREPQGTAGMPILDIIKKNGLTDIIIVVVRYFGGILLGTGGLVHAYSESALGAIRAGTVVKYDIYADTSIEISYSDYQKIMPALDEFQFIAEDTYYSDNVKIKGSVVLTSYEQMEKKLTEITSGRAKIILLDKKYDFR